MLDTARIDPRELRDAFGCFASGVTVVSLRDSTGAPTGITVNSFSSLSLDPALVLFSVGCNQVSCKWLEEGNYFNINVLAADQQATAWQFAKPLDDKFAGVAWTEAANGMPLITNALARFECRKSAIHQGGDHIIVVGEVLGVDTQPGDPLLFYRGQMRDVAA